MGGATRPERQGCAQWNLQELKREREREKKEKYVTINKEDVYEIPIIANVTLHADVLKKDARSIQITKG